MLKNKYVFGINHVQAQASQQQDLASCLGDRWVHLLSQGFMFPGLGGLGLSGPSCPGRSWIFLMVSLELCQSRGSSLGCLSQVKEA